MSQQAEAEYTKASREVSQQEQKIDKANKQIEKEQETQQNLREQKLRIEKEIQVLAKESDEFEDILNGYKENLKLAKEGKFYLISLFSCFCSRLCQIFPTPTTSL